MSLRRWSPVATVGLGALLAALLAALTWPMFLLAAKSVESRDGAFAGLANFRRYLETPALAASVVNTLLVGALATAATVAAAYGLALAFTRMRVPGAGVCRSLCLAPLFVPSLFPALGLVYLLGQQGLASSRLGTPDLYGPFGVFLGLAIYTLPHATLVLTVALRGIDPALYRAARTLGAGPWRRFWTVTLPASFYGLASAALVTFILAITDLGAPRVLGGDFPMLSTELYKQIVGMQDFPMGAVAGLTLLVPAAAAFGLDAWARRKLASGAGGRPGAAFPAPRSGWDWACGAYAWGVAAALMAVLGVVAWGSVVSFWPYDLSFTLDHYRMTDSLYGWSPLWTSLKLGLATATAGTAFVFVGAYLAERGRAAGVVAGAFRLLAMLPAGIPGTALGIAYIFAANKLPSWAHGAAGAFVVMVVNTVVHHYTVAHVMAVNGLRRLDPRYEAVGSTLGAGRAATFFRVILPLQWATVLDIAYYLFLNATTTLSGVVFLYTPEHVPASVAMVQGFDAGGLASASALGVALWAMALAARGALAAAERLLARRGRTTD